jgi:hypothetical protein
MVQMCVRTGVRLWRSLASASETPLLEHLRLLPPKLLATTTRAEVGLGYVSVVSREGAEQFLLSYTMNTNPKNFRYTIRLPEALVGWMPQIGAVAHRAFHM